MARGRSGQPRTRPVPAQDALYERLLRFPERAEYLDFNDPRGYRVRLEHWGALSSVFRRTYEMVYERQSAAVLLVHGDQGTGKTLFARKLALDFEKSRAGVRAVDRENLWHVLTGGEPPDLATVQEATLQSDVKELRSDPGWLAAARTSARDDRHKMRVFVIDDFHKDLFLSEWAGLTRGEYLQLKVTARSALLEAVAQRIVEDCRGDFKRALFVLLSADRTMIDELKAQLDRSHRDLAQILELPLPVPDAKELIVRTNINRLNQRSYWYCLDQGGPEEKQAAYRTLKGADGFIDSFRAIDRALRSGDRDNRRGRPANKNLLTFVTLGTSPDDVAVFLADHEMAATDEFDGIHMRTWLFRRSWASFLESSDPDYVRAAALVESEFALRWIALDARATWALCDVSSPPNAADPLVAWIQATPSIADRKTAEHLATSANQALASLTNEAAITAFMTQFRGAGQGRSVAYEPALARKFSVYGHGLQAYGRLKPDVTFVQYRPCAVTDASTDNIELIKRAIQRECHVAEFTAHLQSDFRGLADYLRDKVSVYAELLESV
jgi:hypothetical protein